MERECSKEENNYKLPLPLRDPDTVFPNNRRMAELRLKNLKKKFIKDEQYHEDYTSFMEDMIKKVYGENSDPKASQQGKTWLIPHHGVITVNLVKFVLPLTVVQSMMGFL